MLISNHIKPECRKTMAFHSAASFIPYGQQWIDEKDIQAVVETLRSDRLTQGPKVKEFEEAFADYVGARYAVAASSGTAALHLACLAAGLGSEDQVITSPITFVASANCALYVGAMPGFVDIDPKSYNLDPKNLETYLNLRETLSKPAGLARNHMPKALIPVHFAGLPCDMPEIYRIAGKYNLIIIEDACHALGAEYRSPRSNNGGQEPKKSGWLKVGSCAHSHMTVFSLHPVKHITTGEGGLVTTNDKALYDRLLNFRSHGITRASEQFVNSKTKDTYEKTPPWYYEMQHLGYNYRITDIQCALGLSQLKKAAWFTNYRRQIAEIYREELGGYSAIQLPQEPDNLRSAYHLFTVRIDFHKIGKDRQKVMQHLARLGVGTQVHYIPVPQHPYYQRLGFRMEDYPEAEQFYQQCLSLPIFAGLKWDEMIRIVEALKQALAKI